MTSKVTGPLFRWFGSKWNASKHYPAPEHAQIFEPYAGSACYSLRHAEKEVTIWDADPNLQLLWGWLINEASEAAIREIPIEGTPGQDIRELGISAGQAMLVKHWQRTNSTGDCWTFSPWHGKPGMWNVNTRARVAAEVGAVKHWKFKPIEFNTAGTWFVDPPYEYNYKYRKGLGDIDYSALAQRLHAIPQPRQVIVCEAACQKTGALPAWLSFQDFRSMVTCRRKPGQNHHSRELIALL